MLAEPWLKITGLRACSVCKSFAFYFTLILHKAASRNFAFCTLKHFCQRLLDLLHVLIEVLPETCIRNDAFFSQIYAFVVSKTWTEYDLCCFFRHKLGITRQICCLVVANEKFY